MQTGPRITFLLVALLLAPPLLAESVGTGDTRPVFQGGPAITQPASGTALYAVRPHDDSTTSATRTAGNRQQLLRKMTEIVPADAIVFTSRILDNFLLVRMTTEQARAVTALDEVSTVRHANASAKAVAGPAPADSWFTQSTSVMTDEETVDPQVGAGIRVAILGTGVDYTHAALGGPGTPGAYQEAMFNANNAWDGFPTAVVTAGRDFASNDFGFDHNPIDPQLRADGFPTGEGTTLASTVHRLAPGAEIMALKITGAFVDNNGDTRVIVPTIERLSAALEYALDPNGDGDTSDGAHIIVLPSHYPMALFGAYYQPDHEGVSSEALIMLLQRVAARGPLIITDTGQRPLLGNGRFRADFNRKYGLPIAAGAPDVLAVGSVDIEPGTQGRLRPTSTHGPVRGSDLIKPDLVAPSSMEVALAGTATSSLEIQAPAIAGARVAAYAARVWSERPHLQAADVKHLLVNTANADVTVAEEDERLVAEPTAVGHGLVAPDSAATAEVVVSVDGERLPSLALGMFEVAAPTTIARHLLLRNFGTADKRFETRVHYTNEEDAGRAEWNVPAEIFVPAGGSTRVPVLLHLDPAKFANWPLASTDDYTPDSWRAAELDGYFNFIDRDGGPSASLAWMFRARARTQVYKDFHSLQELADDAGSELGDGFALSEMTFELAQEIENTGTHPMRLAAFPLIWRSLGIPEDRQHYRRGQLRLAGGGMYPDERCDSGQKMVMAISLWSPVASGASVGWQTFTEEAIETYGMRDGVGPIISFAEDHERGFYVFIDNDEDGKPSTWFIDFSKPYNGFFSRHYKEDRLETWVSPDSRNFISQICAERLLHHEFQTIDDLDHGFGWLFWADDFDYPHLGQPVAEYNPVKFGIAKRVVSWGLLRWVTDGAKVGMRHVDEDGPYGDYFNWITVEPGERVQVHAVRDYLCTYCGGLMLMSLDDSYALYSPVDYLDDDTILPVPADNQVFVVDEHAEAGTVVGEIRLETDGLFALNPSRFLDPRDGMFLMRPLPGDALEVSLQGVISVRNPDALDYEQFPVFVVPVQMKDGNHLSRVVDVEVRLRNLNDNPPVQLAPFDTMNVEPGKPVNERLDGNFHDADGDALSFTATGLPNGMVLNTDGHLLGASQAAGTHNVTLTVSDGAHSIEAALKIVIGNSGQPNGNNPGNGGGGNGGWPLLLLALGCACFRHARRLRLH